MFAKDNSDPYLDKLTFRAAFFESTVLFPLARSKFKPIWLDKLAYRAYEWLLKKDREVYKKYLIQCHGEPH